MTDQERVFLWAEQAVAEIVLDIDESLESVWREVTPADLGLNPDNWLLASKRMVARFNALAEGVTAISLSAPSRAQYRSSDLIEFVVAIADAAEQVL